MEHLLNKENTSKNNNIWIYNPLILFQKEEILNLWPSQSMTFSEKINAITRLIILITVLGYIFTFNNRILFIGFFTLIAIIIYFFIQKKYKMENINKAINNGDIKENFINYRIESENRNKEKIFKYTKPTKQNPVMNVLLTDIADNPKREAAAPSFSKKVENDINNSTQDFIKDNFSDDKLIDNRLFRDLGDSMNFDYSMRNWYATPNTEIPNNQKAFAEFCYGEMISCKEGNEIACTRQMPPRRIDGIE